MSVQILPYSVAEFNKIKSLKESDEEFQLRQGEAFIMSTLRLLLFECDLQDVFGIRLLHKDFDLGEDSKLIDVNNEIDPWHHKDGERFRDTGHVVPTSWRVIWGQGLMPYEFKYLSSDDSKGIDLSDSTYQPFLKDFVDCVEAGKLHDNVSLILRPDVLDKDITRISKSAYNSKDEPEDLTVSWFFHLEPLSPVASEQKATE